jgi:hypothetical protein
MSYRIRYAVSKKKEKNGMCLTMLTVSWFLIFCCLISLYWPKGKAAALRILFPGERYAAVEAAEVFVDSLRCGMDAGDAFRDFCASVTLTDGEG